MFINHATQAGLTEAYAATRMANPLFNQFCELPVCQHMQLEESMHLFSCFDVEKHKAGDVIYTSGDDSDKTMRLIVNGAVIASNPASDIHHRLTTGDVFGLFSFLDQSRPHSSTLTATEDVCLLRINREYFNLITVENAPLGKLLLRFMFLLLSQVSLKMENEYAHLHHHSMGEYS